MLKLKVKLSILKVREGVVMMAAMRKMIEWFVWLYGFLLYVIICLF
jgi:hypothetical protein